MYPLHDYIASMLIPGHPLPKALSDLTLERSGWSHMRRNPVTSGLYEVIVNQDPGNGLEVQEVLLLMWNGKLWLTPAGAAVLGKSIKNSSWRGLTRAAYESACIAVGLPPLDAVGADAAAGQNAELTQDANGSGEAGDEIDLFVGVSS